MLNLPSLLKLPQKIIFFLSWLSLSLFTLLSSTFLLLSLTPSRQNPSVLMGIRDSSYQVFAALPEKGQVLSAAITGKDGRAETLRNYLLNFNSPLADYSDFLTAAADRYNLPWTLLPAIAGKESGFGKVIPSGSYNAWGWGILTGQQKGVSFSSWDDAISRVAAGIKKSYFDKGLNSPTKMEPSYTPPSFESGSHSWKTGVEFFMNQIENWR